MVTRWIGIIVPLLATLSYLTLIGLVLIKGKKSKAIRAFAGFLFAQFVWTMGSLMWHLTASMFWNRVLVSGIALSMLALVFFVIAFLDLQRRLPLYLLLVWEPLAMGLIWSGRVVRASYMENGIAKMEIAPGFAFLMVTGAVVYAWSMLNLVQNLQFNQDPTFRYKIRYLIVGLAIQWTGGLSNALPGIGHHPIDVTAGLINAVLIAYAIWRHRLLDIRVVFRRTLGYSIFTATIAATYLLTVFLWQRLFQTLLGAGAYISAGIIAIVFAILYQPLRDWMQSWVDRVFFRERYDAQRMIEDISHATASVLNLNEMGALVLNKIVSSMAVSRAVLFVADWRKQVFTPLSRIGYEGMSMSHLAADHPVVAWLKETDDVFRYDEVDTLPQFRAMWARERRELDALGIALCFSIKFEGELIGILAVGRKLSEAPYQPDDEAALRTVANSIAVAIENGKLVADLQNRLAELRQAQSQLIEAGKLSAVGQLVAGVAHELNNPLTTIKGYSQILHKEAVSEDIKRDLKRIDEAAERCRRIVRNLLTFARRDGSDKTMCDINQIVVDALSLQEYRLKVENIEVVRNLANDLPLTLVDRYQLQQVVLNIITNAQQAMRATNGGTLTVTSALTRGYVRLSIRDTGPGMSAEVRTRIFEPFFTTKEVGEGSGLGLSICYGIIQEHGGKITVNSEPGKGAEFVIDLPLRSSETVECPDESTTPTLSVPAKRRVLVVDDEEAILALVKRVLEDEGFVVDTATTGLQALENLDKESGKEYEVILSDVKMPGLDGPRLYAHLRYDRPGWENRIIFMTGDTSSPDTQAFLESIQFPYLMKPFDIDSLKAMLCQRLADLTDRAQQN